MTNQELLLEISNMFQIQLQAQLQPIKDQINRLEKRMDRLEARMSGLEKRMDSMERRMDGLETRMDSMERRMDDLEKRMDSMERRMDSLEKCMEGLGLHVNGLDIQIAAIETFIKQDLTYRITKMEMIVENKVVPIFEELSTCYVDTYERYAKETYKIEVIEQDVSVLKTVVAGHSRKLEQLS